MNATVTKKIARLFSVIWLALFTPFAASYSVTDSELFLACKNLDGSSTQYQYAPTGELAQQIKPSGQVITYNRDALGRATQVHYYANKLDRHRVYKISVLHLRGERQEP